MLANSWLYHYYSVHTKIQFGLPYKGSTRVPPTTSYYHHSPTIQGSLTHPYHLTYGFSSTDSVTAHQGSPGLISYHNGSSNTHHGSNVSNEHFRSHRYRIDPLQPIDYSQITPLNIQIDSRYGTNKGNTITSGNPLKRKAIARVEPLYIAGSKSIIDVSTVELHSQHATDGSILLLTIPTRHRFYTKVMPVDSTTEFMDQWNPSPPWSESAQKVPDIIRQELSPYLTTTPPTPTSAPLNSHTNHGPAFSFDWMPEQFVPVTNNTTSTHNNAVHCQAMLNWSTNRLLSLDRLDRRLSDDDTRSE